MPLDQSIIQAGAPPSLSAQDFENQITGPATQRLKLQSAQTEEQAKSLALKQAQEQADAQKDLDEVLQKHTTQQPDGSYKVDFGGVTGDLAQRGRGRAANAALGMESSYINNAFLQKQNQLKLTADTLHMASSVARAIPQVDPYETDPIKIAAQKDAFVGGVGRALPTLIQLGVLDPNTAGYIHQTISTQGYTPQIGEMVNQFANQGEDAEKQVLMHHQQMEDARTSLITPADVRAKDAETADRNQGTAERAEKLKKEQDDAARQALSSVGNQDDLDAFRKAHPGFLVPSVYDAGSIAKIVRAGVPIDKQPEYDTATRTAAQMAAMTPEQWSKRVDAVVPPDTRAALNARTKTLVQDAVSRGDFKGADAAIKDASDQQGRTETAVETAKNTLPMKVELQQSGQSVLPKDPVGPQGSGLSGEEYLALVPDSIRGRVKAIAEGRAPMPSGYELSRGQGGAIQSAVYHYDPEWSEQRAQVRKNLIAGKGGDNIGALNTGTVHLDQLSDAANAMANGSFRPGNQLYNTIRSAFGSSAVTNFEGLKTAVAGEMATALKGNATDQEVRAISDAIQSKNSPKQLADYIDEQLHVLGAKLNTYQERYTQQIPNDKVWSPVLPSAAAVYSKHGINPTAGPATNVSGGGKVEAIKLKDGTTLIPHDQAAADKFRKDHADKIQ